MKKTSWSGRRSFSVPAIVICLVIALLFWLFVMFVMPPDHYVTCENIAVTVEYGSLSGYTATPSRIASVSVVGKREDLLKLKDAPIAATVSLDGVDPATLPDMELSLPVSFTLPEGVSIATQEPVYVKVVLTSGARLSVSCAALPSCAREVLL